MHQGPTSVTFSAFKKEILDVRHALQSAKDPLCFESEDNGCSIPRGCSLQAGQVRKKKPEKCGRSFDSGTSPLPVTLRHLRQ